MSLFKTPASRGLTALTASAVVTNFELLNTQPALHFSAIAVAVADQHSGRFRIPSSIRDRLIEAVWQDAARYAPQLSDHFMAFAALSSRAIRIWREGEASPATTYFERHFSKTVPDVSLEEFLQVYDDLTGAFVERLDREMKNWQAGK